jgi:hypothetical protein
LPDSSDLPFSPRPFNSSRKKTGHAEHAPVHVFHPAFRFLPDRGICHLHLPATRRINIAPCLIDLLAQRPSLIGRQTVIAALLA